MSKVRQYLAQRQAHLPIRPIDGAPPTTIDSRVLARLQQRQVEAEREIEEDEEERREERREARLDRRMQREVERRRMLAEVGLGRNGSNGHGQDIAAAMREAMAPVTRALEQMQSSQREDRLLSGIQAIADGIKHSGSAAPSVDAQVRASMETATGIIKSARELVETVQPPAAASSNGESITMTHEQVLRQLAIEEEVSLRRADLRDRMDQREWEKQKVREEFQRKRDQTDKMFEGLQEIAVPALGAIFGERVVNEMMKRATGGTGANLAAGQPNQNGQQMAPALVRWRCHNCGAINADEAGKVEVECPNCGVPGRLDVPAEQPAHIHQHHPPQTSEEPAPPLEVITGGSGDEEIADSGDVL